MNTELQKLESLFAHTNDARKNTIEIEGITYEAKKYTVGRIPAIYEAFNSLAKGLKGVDLSQVAPEDLTQFTAELCVLIANSVDLKGRSPLSFTEEEFSKLLSLAINTNISFFAQRLASTIQAQHKK